MIPASKADFHRLRYPYFPWHCFALNPTSGGEKGRRKKERWKDYPAIESSLFWFRFLFAITCGSLEGPRISRCGKYPEGLFCMERFFFNIFSFSLLPVVSAPWMRVTANELLFPFRGVWGQVLFVASQANSTAGARLTHHILKVSNLHNERLNANKE
ncbi:hypothetical protein HOY80DRAFT_271213 [Tuber brumale]|nr:hypothetical protein HOY80DRAFT_271213 [Tuber brumale]